MSEINNVKPTGQNAVNSTRNTSVKDNRSAAKSSAAETSVVASDKVSLTDTATQLQALQQEVAGASGVDENRVAELRAAIADGSYQVDSTELARKMIDFEGQL